MPVAYPSETRDAITAIETQVRQEKSELRDQARATPDASVRALLREEIAIVQQAADASIQSLKDAANAAREADKATPEDKEGGTDGPGKGVFSSEAITDLADNLIARFFTHSDGEYTLRYWSGNWWQWSRGRWEQESTATMRVLVRHRVTEEAPQGLHVQYFPREAREALFDALCYRLNLPKDTAFNTWLPYRDEDSPTAQLDTDGTWVASEQYIYRADVENPVKVPITPRYWTACSIPRIVPPDSMGKLPTAWHDFLGEVLEQDPERYMILQEWFGYCCLPSTRLQKILMLVGEGGNGKSTVLNVLKALIGRKNVSNCSLTNLSTKYGAYTTFGKLVNSYDDISTRYMKDTGELKAFTGSGDITFERKYCDPFSASPTARLCFSMNAVPRTDDDSDGLWRRLLIFPFQYTPEAENAALADLEHPDCPFPAEMDQIFAWSLQGLCRLLRQGHFTYSTICDTSKEYWRDTNESVRRYAKERLLFHPAPAPAPEEGCDSNMLGRQNSTLVRVISEDYAMWCKVNREKPFAAQGLDQRLRRCYSKKGGLRKADLKFGSKLLPHWIGLTLNPEAPSLGTPNVPVQ